MTTKNEHMQRLTRLFKEERKVKEVDMKDVAKFAVLKGWRLPVPTSPIDLLARQFADAARAEIRKDKGTGRPYRANHAVIMGSGPHQYTLWIDIDEKPPKHMFKKSVVSRREGMVNDGVQLTFDIDHWNSISTEADQIHLPMDLTQDIEWRKNAPDEDQKAA